MCMQKEANLLLQNCFRAVLFKIKEILVVKDGYGNTQKNCINVKWLVLFVVKLVSKEWVIYYDFNLQIQPI